MARADRKRNGGAGSPSLRRRMRQLRQGARAGRVAVFEASGANHMIWDTGLPIATMYHLPQRLLLMSATTEVRP